MDSGALLTISASGSKFLKNGSQTIPIFNLGERDALEL